MSSRRGPYKVGLEKRTGILSAALAEFARVGYEAASVRSIAESAGISHAGLLHHFNSKQDLLLAVLADQEDRDREVTRRHVTSADPEAILAALTSVAARHAADPSWARLWITLKLTAADDANHVAHAYIARRSAAWVDELATMLALAQTKGLIRAEIDCRAAAVGLLALHEGLFIQAVVDPGTDIDGSLRWALDQMRT